MGSTKVTHEENWQLEETARSFAKAARADPAALEAWRGLAKVLTQLGRGADAQASLHRALAAPDLLPSTELTLLVASAELAGEMRDRRGADDATARLRRLARATRSPMQHLAFDHLRRLATEASKRSFEQPTRIRLHPTRAHRAPSPDASHLATPTESAGLGKLLAAAVILVVAGAMTLSTLNDEPTARPTPATPAADVSPQPPALVTNTLPTRRP